MAGMELFYPLSAVERAMKVQEVFLQAMAKKITWWQAAEILGISARHMRRWRERYQQFGFGGLLDRDAAGPVPSAWPWPPWRRCCDCTGKCI
jgi:hypothetical protein